MTAAFKKGDRVRLNNTYLQRVLSDRKRLANGELIGTITREPNAYKGAACVLWDGRKAPTYYSTSFLEAVRSR